MSEGWDEAYKSTDWCRDVVAGRTSVSQVRDGQPFLYRGIDVGEIINQKWSFEDVAFLLIHGQLPREQPEAAYKFETQLHESRHLPPPVTDFIASLGDDASYEPIDALRTAISILGHWEPIEPRGDPSVHRATEILARVPTIIGRIERVRQDGPHHEDPGDMRFAEYMYRMLTNSEPPCPEFIDLLEASLILYADHGFAASTFAVRTIASTLTDIHGAIVGGIAALTGIRHGGANKHVAEELLDRNDPAIHIRYLKHGGQMKKVPGFGHPVLRDPDPRVKILMEQMNQHRVALANHDPNDYLERGEIALKEVQRIWRRGDETLHPNLEFPAAILYRSLGIDPDFFTTIFAAARITGWCAHFLEQRREPRMIRPRSAYIPVEAEVSGD